MHKFIEFPRATVVGGDHRESGFVFIVFLNVFLWIFLKFSAVITLLFFTFWHYLKFSNIFFCLYIGCPANTLAKCHYLSYRVAISGAKHPHLLRIFTSRLSKRMDVSLRQNISFDISLWFFRLAIQCISSQRVFCLYTTSERKSRNPSNDRAVCV